MPDHSDSDSSPKASSSSSSSSSSEEEEKPAMRAEDSAAYADPGSPSNAQQSSDESNSSDGVLVELPGQPDQDTRGLRGDPESGILVNIDGSVLEPPEDAGREETFEDASEELATPARRRVGGLEESMAVIEIGEQSGTGFVSSDDLALVQARLEDALAECQKYKEEREVFGRDIAGLRQQLRDFIAGQSLLAETYNPQLEMSKDEDIELSSPTPLRSMLSNCSKYIIDLKGILDQRLELESRMIELQAALGAKDKIIEDLTTQASQSSVSHDVIVSYLDSMWDIRSESLKESTDAVIKRLLGSLESVVGEEHASSELSLADGIFLLEKKTLMLVEKHTQFLSEAHQLRQCLVEVRPEFETSEANELGSILGVAQEELLTSRRKEAYLQEKMEKVEEENSKLAERVDKMRERLEAANADTNKTKAELDQAENKLLQAKEKLSIAVSKGKSLVQHRDSLKQSLAEKMSELERCMQELQQKSETLQATEANLEELKQLLLERTNELQKCSESLQQKDDALEAARASAEELSEVKTLVGSLQESIVGKDMVLQEIEELISQTNFPPEVLSVETIDKVRWLTNQKNVADIIILENQKIKEAISSIEFPEDVSSSEIDSSIYWLSNSLTQAKNEIVKLQDEINGVQLALLSYESKLTDEHKEIDLLKSSLMEEKQAKSSLFNELENLKYEYEGIVEKFSMVSSEKDNLMKVLLEVSESTLDDQASTDTSMIAEKCSDKIKEKMSSSLSKAEQFEKIQTLLYIRDVELRLCEKVLEVEMIDRSAMKTLSEEFARVSQEVVSLRNEKDSIQKELLRAEEKSSLLREKLSMAVKKGKGLVQEREGFKISLDEKATEIEKLKQEMQQKDSQIMECQEQIKNLSVYPEQVQKLESDLVSLKNQRDENERIMRESNHNLQQIVDLLEKIVLPTDYLFEGPLEKVNWMSNHIQESEAAKVNAVEQLNKVKEEANLQASKLHDALAIIRSLEDELSKAQEHISLVTEEISSVQLGKASMEQELEKIREESTLQVSKLADASAAIKSLEDALSEAEKKISLVSAESNQAEDKSKNEIVELNAKLAERTEELAQTLARLEEYRNGVYSQIERLHIFSKDETLLFKMYGNLNKMIEGLRSLGLLIQSMHNQLSSKGHCLQPSMEHDSAFEKLSALPKIEDFMTSRAANTETSTTDNRDIWSLARIVEGIYTRAEYLGNHHEDFFRYLDGHIADTLQAFQATTDELVHVLELNESLKLNLEELEVKNLVQEAKAVSSQKEMKLLLSACLDATQELLTELGGSGDYDPNFEQDIYNSSLDSRSKGSVSAGAEDSIADEYVKTADSLLLAARRIRVHCQQLANAEKVSLTATEDMKTRLRQAELSAENAIHAGQLQQERVSSLEKDLEELKEVGTKMKTEIEKYQAKEDLLQAKEEECSSIQHALSLKDKGISGQVFSEKQMESLFDKVNKIEIPLSESETQGQELLSSGPVEKLFYVVEKVVDLHNKVESLVDEKEDMQLILASHLREIEHLKQVAATNDHDLQSKKADLSDMTLGLEKIIQKMGGYDLIQDQKTMTAKALLTVLERLATALSLESENSKSKTQELTAKLLAKDKVIDEWSMKVKVLEDSIHSRTEHQEITKERSVFDGSSALVGSEISEIEDVGSLGRNSVSSVPTAAHARTMRKGSNDHLVLNIGSESEHLIAGHKTDDKGHVFKSLNTSGVIPKQGKLLADRIDGIWVSGGQLLMRRPGARLGLIVYWIFLHLWLLGTIL